MTSNPTLSATTSGSPNPDCARYGSRRRRACRSSSALRREHAGRNRDRHLAAGLAVVCAWLLRGSQAPAVGTGRTRQASAHPRPAVRAACGGSAVGRKCRNSEGDRDHPRAPCLPPSQVELRRASPWKARRPARRGTSPPFRCARTGDGAVRPRERPQARRECCRTREGRLRDGRTRQPAARPRTEGATNLVALRCVRAPLRQAVPLDPWRARDHQGAG